jgi:hypothetical protein
MGKVWGFHGGDYENCRLLGYNNPVRTSQETHYFSAIESNQLMLSEIWGFRGSDYEECRLLGYKNPVRTSQETRYVSATGSSQLMLCKIWGLHGGDYEEWRLLGYKNPVPTSQETHYFSATESSRLMLCKIWGLHGGDYEECRLLGYNSPVRANLVPGLLPREPRDLHEVWLLDFPFAKLLLHKSAYNCIYERENDMKEIKITNKCIYYLFQHYHLTLYTGRSTRKPNTLGGPCISGHIQESGYEECYFLSYGDAVWLWLD